MSLGTGQTFSSRKNPNLSDLLPPDASNPKSPNSLSWKGKFLKVLDSATDTESVHHTLTELLPPDVYFRFNPHISEMISMDEAKSDKLGRLQDETREYLTRNLEKVDYCCQMLTKPKSVVRKVRDWWSLES
jgi:calcium-independent phospholipase A2-gamma